MRNVQPHSALTSILTPRVEVWLLLSLAVLLMLGCSTTNGSGRVRVGDVHGEVGYDPHDEGVHRHEYDTDEYDEDGYPRGRAQGKLGIPPGHLPRPGYCRIWYPGTPPGRQPAPRPCDHIDHDLPRGAWLLHRPSDHPEHVHVRRSHDDDDYAEDHRGRGKGKQKRAKKHHDDPRYGHEHRDHDGVSGEIRVYDAESGVFIRIAVD